MIPFLCNWVLMHLNFYNMDTVWVPYTYPTYQPPPPPPHYPGLEVKRKNKWQHVALLITAYPLFRVFI